MVREGLKGSGSCCSALFIFNFRCSNRKSKIVNRLSSSQPRPLHRPHRKRPHRRYLLPIHCLVPRRACGRRTARDDFPKQLVADQFRGGVEHRAFYLEPLHQLAIQVVRLHFDAVFFVHEVKALGGVHGEELVGAITGHFVLAVHDLEGVASGQRVQRMDVQFHRQLLQFARGIEDFERAFPVTYPSGGEAGLTKKQARQKTEKQGKNGFHLLILLP